jgi:hemoglobin
MLSRRLSMICSREPPPIRRSACTGKARAGARQFALDFLCASMGGPAIYLGRDMKTLHQGMGISDADWEVLMQHAWKTLDDLGVAGPESKEVQSFLEGLKADIVEARGVQTDK